MGQPCRPCSAPSSGHRAMLWPGRWCAGSRAKAARVRRRASLRGATPMSTPAAAPSRKPLPAWTLLLMGASYPLLAHVAALTGRPALIAASLGLLVVLVLLPAL